MLQLGEMPREDQIGNDKPSTSIDFATSPTMAGPTITEPTKNVLVFFFLFFALIMGYVVSTQPSEKGWRFFSWHPFLMVLSFVGMMGASAIIKKKGGYANTKIHGILSSLAVMAAAAGFYVIYRNKNEHQKNHITTVHASVGIVTLVAAVMPMFAGVVFLHPDFGIDKTNAFYRSVHKWFGRLVMVTAWVTCVLGLKQLTNDLLILGLFTAPLLILSYWTLL